MLGLIVLGCNSSDSEGKKLSSNLNSVKEASNENNQNKTSTSNEMVTLPNQIEIGIESIVEKNEMVEINVYSLNSYPIAGVQFEITPKDIFEIDSINGGRCSNVDFTLKSNKEGLMLGFSMSGNLIPVSKSKDNVENILFTAYGKKIKKVRNEIITIQATIAGKGGTRLDVVSIPYSWTSNF